MSSLDGSASGDRPRNRARWYVERVLFATVVLFGVTLLFHDIGEPFKNRTGAYNSALFSIAGRNHVERGLSETRFGTTVNPDPEADRPLEFYTHHPPMLSVAAAASFALFGQHEWSARLVPILFTLGSFALILLIGSELGSLWYAAVAAAIYAVVPMTTVFGRMLNHEAPTQFFVLLAAWSYLRWRRSGEHGWFLATAGAICVGALFGWPAYYLGLLFPLHYWLTEKWERRSAVVAWLVVACFAMFALHLAHVAWLMGWSAVTDLAQIFLYRIGSSAVDSKASAVQVVVERAAASFGWGEFALRELVEAGNLLSKPVLLLSAVGAVDVVRRIRGAQRPSVAGFPFVLLAVGLIHIVLFRQGAWIHEYWGFYLTAGAVLLAAAGLETLARGRWRLPVLLVSSGLIVWSVLPEYEFYRQDRFPEEPPFGRFLNEHSVTGDRVYTNGSLTGPRVTYYARRDLRYSPVKTPDEIRSLEGELFVLDRTVSGAEELAPWLRMSAEHVADFPRDPRIGLYRLKASSRSGSGS